MSTTPTKQTTRDLAALKAEWSMAAVAAFALTSVFLSLAVTVGPFAEPVQDYLRNSTQQNVPKLASRNTPRIPLKSGFPTHLEEATIQESKKLFAEQSVEGVIISGVDFEKNSFTNVYETHRDVTDDSFHSSKESYSLIGNEPTFNDLVFRLLNGKLDCQETDALAGFKGYLNNPKVSWTCAVAIPPVEYASGNSFGGFLSVLLNTKPSMHVEKFITAQAVRTAATIFPETGSVNAP